MLGAIDAIVPRVSYTENDRSISKPCGKEDMLNFILLRARTILVVGLDPHEECKLEEIDRENV